jgi:hypothetical protein
MIFLEAIMLPNTWLDLCQPLWEKECNKRVYQSQACATTTMSYMNEANSTTPSRMFLLAGFQSFLVNYGVLHTLCACCDVIYRALVWLCASIDANYRWYGHNPIFKKIMYACCVMWILFLRLSNVNRNCALYHI